MSTTSHTLFITGAAGYVGAMLVDQFSKRPDVSKIICLDKDMMPEILRGNQKVEWIQANAKDSNWIPQVARQMPDVVIDTKWQIREMYGNQKTQWQWNVEGSENVFRFALDTASVKRLIYFSTASVYGAFADNSLDHRYEEGEPLREKNYLYGVEKRVVEERLQAMRAEFHANRPDLKISVVRPAAITGPRGRSMHHRFGLQSALSGQLRGSFVYSIVRLMVSFVPATKGWVRQFIHEDDVTDIVALLSFGDIPHTFDIFNITPPGAPVLPKDMASAVKKSILPVSPWMVRVAFFVLWHLTRGRVPSAPGSWRFYSYPIVMDGSKITRKLQYQYRFKEPREAFIKMEGRYAKK